MTTMYTPDHEWVNIEDHEAAVVGITHHAQDALGDVVFVELPEVGRTYKRGEVTGVVESVKAAADIYMPCEGEIVEVNDVVLKGLPNEVYLHAYLMAAPFVRTDCKPLSGDC